MEDLVNKETENIKMIQEYFQRFRTKAPEKKKLESPKSEKKSNMDSNYDNSSSDQSDGEGQQEAKDLVNLMIQKS